jgi:hypothetical protein
MSRLPGKHFIVTKIEDSLSKCRASNTEDKFPYYDSIDCFAYYRDTDYNDTLPNTAVNI